MNNPLGNPYVSVIGQPYELLGPKSSLPILDKHTSHAFFRWDPRPTHPDDQLTMSAGLLIVPETIFQAGAPECKPDPLLEPKVDLPILEFDTACSIWVLCEFHSSYPDGYK